MATIASNIEPDREHAPAAARVRTPLPGWKAGLAAFALLVALLVNLLLFHEYPVLTPEAGLALLALAGVAALYGGIYALSNWWIRALLEALLIAAVLDSAAAPVPLRIGGGIVVLAFVLWKRRSVLPFATVAALAATAAGAMGIGQQHQQAMSETVRPNNAAAPNANLPAIVHIILDEHIGIDGLPSDNPHTPTVRAALDQFYLGHGFRVFGRAHSDYAFTGNSIPEILNFGVRPPKSKVHRRTPATIGYFDLLASKGYKLKVYQSERLNYCDVPAVVTCLTYQTQSIQGVAALPLSTETKATIILRKLVSQTDAQVAAWAYSRLRRLGAPLPYREITDIRLNPVNSARVFDRFNADLRQARPGEVYFAHFLLPHSPYALTSDCRVKDELWKRRQYDGPLQVRQDADFEQILCALRKVAAAYDAVSSSPAGHNFVMIVHGDHGSRITDAEPFANRAQVITDQQKIADFSALFVARGPGLAPGYDDARLSNAAILENLARSNFTTGHAPLRSGAHNFVILADHRNVPRVRVPLPAGW
jgi:hypothetical protein